jgi:hypothetical protein
MMFMRKTWLAAMLFAALGGMQLWAQADRGTITGTVTDPSGAVIAGVRVVAANTATGAEYESLTNQIGIYSIMNLPIGSYRATYMREGFAALDHTGLELSAAQVLKIDVKLKIGSSQEVVTVSAVPPMAETETSNVGTTLESAEMTDLPLNVSGGRDASSILYATTPTMVGTGSMTADHIAGSASYSKTILIDGTDGNNGMQGYVFTPGMDAIEEMQSQVSGINVEGAGTGGGVIMYELKSGTNQFHGSAFGFMHNEAMDANTWSNKYYLSAYCLESDSTCHNTYKRARNRLDDEGFSAGGPLWRNRTFIFGDYEHYNATDLRQNPTGASVPTSKMLSGDFSELLTMGTYSGTVTTTPGVVGGTPITNPCTGEAYQYGQIFDPDTWTTVSGVPCGKPFEGNIIPTGRLSSVSKKLATVYEKYYAPTVSGRLIDNYPSMTSSAPWWHRTNVDLKLDHNFSSKNHANVSFNYMSVPVRAYGALFSLQAGGGPLSSAWDQRMIDRNFRILDSYSITPNLLNSAMFSMAQNFAHERPDTEVDPTDYGFTGTDNSANFPVISYGGSNGVTLTGTGTSEQDYYALNGFHFADKMFWSKGRHNISFGGEFTAQQNNSNYGGNVQTYAFANNTGGPIDSYVTPWTGSGFANLMLGDVQSASMSLPHPSYDRRKLFDFFVADDVKVSRRFTLNVGLRWDITMPLHEKYGHWTNWDMSANNTVWGDNKGAWTFAENGSTSFEKYNDFHQFGPHVGGAYQITSRLVARAAWGLFYVPLGMNQWVGSSNPGDQNYFYYGTNEVTNNVSGSTAFNWDNGYPGKTTYRARTSTENYIGSIWPIEIDPNELHLGRTQNWNVGIEYQINPSMLLLVNYVGNTGRDLHDGNLKAYQNYPNWSTWQKLYLSGNIYASVSDESSASALGISYPFSGFLGYAWEAISPIPQVAEFMGLVSNAGAPIGSSSYNAFIVEVKSKHSHGLSMDMSYTLSKATGNVAGDTNFWNAGTTYWYQSIDDFKSTDHVLSYDTRHIFKGYVTYDFPFGKGKWLGGNVGRLDPLIGGWSLGFQPSYTSGTPLSAVGSSMVYPGWMGLRANLASGAKLGNHFKKLDLLNLSDSSNQFFSKSDFANPTAGYLGNSPFIYNNWRNWAVLNENLSILKHFSFGESRRYSASIRAEFYDVFNRHAWGSPDTNSVGDTYFGQVTSVSGNRTGQFGARFQW